MSCQQSKGIGPNAKVSTFLPIYSFTIYLRYIFTILFNILTGIVVMHHRTTTLQCCTICMRLEHRSCLFQDYLAVSINYFCAIVPFVRILLLKLLLICQGPVNREYVENISFLKDTSILDELLELMPRDGQANSRVQRNILGSKKTLLKLSMKLSKVILSYFQVQIHSKHS